MRITINGWKFNVSSNGESVHMVADNGFEYHAIIMRNSNKILINKIGTTRFLRFPQFVIDNVLKIMKEKTGNSELYIINKSK